MGTYIYLLNYVISYTKNGITDIRHKKKAYTDIEEARNYGINYNSFGIPDRELIHFEIEVITLDFKYQKGKSGTYKN